jgi:uroporphyrinogen-III synthase
MTDRSNPLTGLRVLVGRARHQASALSAGLKALGAEVIEIPFIEIRPPRSYMPLDSALKRIADYDWLILTSVNGVDAVASRLNRLKIKSESLSSAQVAAIGPSTRDAAEQLGFKVAIVPKQYVAESIVESLRGKVEGKRVLLARAKVARDVIPRELRKLGARVDVVEAYETVVPKSSQKIRALMRSPKLRPNVVTFTSSSTVRNFVQLLGGKSRGQECPRHKDLDGIQFASIGPITSATLRELGLAVNVEAREFTVLGLIEAIVSKVSLAKPHRLS